MSESPRSILKVSLKPSEARTDVLRSHVLNADIETDDEKDDSSQTTATNNDSILTSVSDRFQQSNKDHVRVIRSKAAEDIRRQATTTSSALRKEIDFYGFEVS